MRELPSMPEKNADEPLQHGGLCPECQTGAFHLVYLTYFTWLNDELVTVPNFPAWVCDVCGRRNYDPRAIIWLNTLLHPETGRRSAGKKGPRPRRNRPAA